ncbi:N-formylglutamate amidohydrolase [Pararhodobacter oceanensis]|uniref:N-formylglutamate amidohydrolase n=1 Tax=Pararhodobacter oceanensis TaxID=2172121 RepID=A0A2T8HS11_9RHOB|nr:N-formylglutamate amidohydrolase [Pararhodobacter oceanensis]PVH28218.1 N-formylglutamate amidohydrolase [Pararhodobacter oceanensis]
MTQQISAPLTLPRYPGTVEYWQPDGSKGRGAPTPALVLICEHASNALPEDVPELGGDLGLDAETRASHAAYDIGALSLSRLLAAQLAPVMDGAALIHAPLSRLAYDLNRPPDHPGAMPVTSEIHQVPGNRDLSMADRMARLEAIYLPFQATVTAEIARLVLLGRRPVVIAVHSFTPVYFGTPREVEFGILFDDDEGIARHILQASAGSGLVTRLNEPYSAQSSVAHTTRIHARPMRLNHAMLEIRNDLIADAAGQAAMAQRLAPILTQALTSAELTAADPPPTPPA